MPKYVVVKRDKASPWGRPARFDWATEALRHVHRLLAGEEPEIFICDVEAKKAMSLEDLQDRSTQEEAFK